MSKGQPRKSRSEIETIISKVKFRDRRFLLLDKGDGYLLQLAYEEPDVATGKVETQKSRKYYISPWMTTSEIVETAFLAVQRSMQHVVSEWFTFDGRQIYSQHFSLSARINACDGRAFDARVPLPAKKVKAGADHKDVLEYYCRAYHKYFEGAKPFVSARTGKAVKDLLKLMPADEVKATIDKAFEDLWFVRNGAELHYVSNNVNKYHVKPEAPPPQAKPVEPESGSVSMRDARPLIENLQRKLQV